MSLENIKNNINFKNFRFDEKKKWTEYHMTCDVYFKETKLAEYTFNILENLFKTNIRVLNGCSFEKEENKYIVAIEEYYQNFLKLSKESMSKVKKELVNFAQSANNKMDKDNVLFCLINDYNSFLESENFDDFCDIFGYDTDSIKALEIYKALEKNFIVFSKTFNIEEIKEMQDFYQDF